MGLGHKVKGKNSNTNSTLQILVIKLTETSREIPQSPNWDMSRQENVKTEQTLVKFKLFSQTFGSFW